MFLFLLRQCTSVIFSLNIAIGNASLRYVSVNFNQGTYQIYSHELSACLIRGSHCITLIIFLRLFVVLFFSVMRSLVPGVVMIFSSILLKKTYSLQQRIALVPVVFGVMLACFGEIHFTNLGFFVTAFCVVLAAFKVTVSNLVLTGDLKLAPLDLLSKMCPLAFIEILLMSYAAGEFHLISENWDAIVKTKALPIVLVSGISSFSLNITSFFANKVCKSHCLGAIAK